MDLTKFVSLFDTTPVLKIHDTISTSISIPPELPMYANLSLYVSLTIGCIMLIFSFACRKDIGNRQLILRVVVAGMLLYSAIIRIVYYTPGVSVHVPIFCLTTVFDVFYIVIFGLLLGRIIQPYLNHKREHTND